MTKLYKKHPPLNERWPMCRPTLSNRRIHVLLRDVKASFGSQMCKLKWIQVLAIPVEKIYIKND